MAGRFGAWRMFARSYRRLRKPEFPGYPERMPPNEPSIYPAYFGIALTALGILTTMILRIGALLGNALTRAAPPYSAAITIATGFGADWPWGRGAGRDSCCPRLWQRPRLVC